MRRKITCPYCSKTTDGVTTEVNPKQSCHVICHHCHKPIAIYKYKAEALQHTDRAIKAISLEELEYDDDGTYLEFLENEFAPSQYLHIPTGKSILGRFNPKSTADIQLMTSDPSMDRNHSVLVLNDKGWLTIMDNDSMTGTFVNGIELEPNERRRLSDGDVLTLGATTVIVHLRGNEEELMDWND